MRYLIGVLSVLGLLVLPARQALACSAPAPSVSIYAQGAAVVAVGTLVDDRGGVITLQVEEYLKGALRTPALLVNNHTFDGSPNCEISLGARGRMPEGLRVLAFLQRDEFRTGANWRPVGMIGEGILKVEGGQLQSTTWETPPLGSLEEAKAQLASLVGPAHAPDPSVPAETASGTNGRAAPGDRWNQEPVALGLVALGVAALALVAMRQLRRRRTLS